MTAEATINTEDVFTLSIDGLVKTQFFISELVAIQSWIGYTDKEYTYHINYFLVRKKTKVKVHDVFWDRKHWEAVLKAIESPKRQLL